MSQTILIIDHDLSFLKLAYQALGRQYQLHCISHPDGLAAKLYQTPPDLILWAKASINEDSRAVFARLQAHCPLIALIYHENDLEELTQLDLSPDDYLLKPTTGAYLSARVQALLGRQQKPVLPGSWVIIQGDVLQAVTPQAGLARFSLRNEEGVFFIKYAQADDGIQVSLNKGARIGVIGHLASYRPSRQDKHLAWVQAEEIIPATDLATIWPKRGSKLSRGV